MEENKKKNNLVYIVIIVILLIVILCLGAYIFTNKNNNESKNNTVESNGINSNTESVQQNDKSNTNSTEAEKNSIIMFNGSKALNSKEKGYTLAAQGSAGIWVTVDATQKVLTFSFTPTNVVKYYSLKWTSKKNSVSKSKINFNKKIVDVFFGGMGQDSSGDTLFILLEDGTVEYIPIVHMFNHVQTQPESYGIIKGVSDVVKFSLANTTDGVTTVAIKSDGSFYDLWYSLEKTGNY